MKPRLVLGSRGSALALAQVRLVREALLRSHPDLGIEVKIITTSGDQRQDVRAGEGGVAGLKGLFTKEIQEALIAGEIDAAVHSLKDLPGATPPELVVDAVLPRADASDLLISLDYRNIESLPPAASIGTGSIRRRRQLQRLRPGLEIVELRGNVPTRLQKLVTESLEGIVLARAGLDRLGYTISGDHLYCDFGMFLVSPLDILPAIGQGVIGIETRRNDLHARVLARSINHLPTHTCIRVERELLRLLEGDCRLPVAARATLDECGMLHADAILFPDDESAAPVLAGTTGHASDPESVGRSLFHQFRPVV